MASPRQGPRRRRSKAAIATFEQVGEGFRMTAIKLSIRGEVDGIDGVAFQEAAEAAKENCPVSQALKGNVDVSLDASL
jgi:osmotically inducible protein OsmC